MQFDIVDAIRAQFGPGVVQHLARGLEEDASAVSRALDVAVPEVADGLLQQGATEAGARELRTSLVAGGFDGPMVARLAGMLDGGPASRQLAERGLGLFPGLFGSRQGVVIEQVAHHAGMRGRSATSLLGVVAPLALGVLGRTVEEGGLDGPALRALLHAQQPAVRAAFPPGYERDPSLEDHPVEPVPLHVVDSPGEVPEPASPASEAATRPEPRRVSAPMRRIQPVQSRDRIDLGRWLLPAALAILLVLGWSLLRNRTHSVGEGVAPGTRAERREEPASESFPEKGGAMGRVDLPGGGTLRAPENSGLYQLASTLAHEQAGAGTGGSGAPGGRRFSFDELAFPEGSARLTGSSERAVQDLARVLRAWPDARVRIEGHTSGTPEPGHVQLAQERADAVQGALVQLGIDKSRVQAVGHGDSDPVADSRTPEGRRANARTDVILVGR